MGELSAELLLTRSRQQQRVFPGAEGHQGLWWGQAGCYEGAGGWRGLDPLTTLGSAAGCGGQ